jgi:hypothetical protein
VLTPERHGSFRRGPRFDAVRPVIELALTDARVPGTAVPSAPFRRGGGRGRLRSATRTADHRSGRRVAKGSRCGCDPNGAGPTRPTRRPVWPAATMGR